MHSMCRCRTIAAAILLVTTTFATTATHAGLNEWTLVGPDGGPVVAVAFLPGRPGVAVAATRFDKIWRTTNGGASWTLVTRVAPSSPRRFAVDPSNPDRIAVASIPMYRSSDAGLTFQAAAPIAGNGNVIVDIAFTDDGATLYALSEGGRVYRSTNFGQSWDERSSGLPVGSPTAPAGADLATSPQDSNILYVAYSSGGVYRTADGGSSWSALNVPNGAHQSVAVDPANAINLLVASNTGLHRSLNAGLTWNTALNGNIAWIGFAREPAGQAVAVQVQGAIMRTPNSGDTWTGGEVIRAGEILDGSFDSGNPAALMIATLDGIVWSGNAGASIEIRNSGLLAGFAAALATTKALPGAIYASFIGPGGVQRQTPGQWDPVNNEQLRVLLGSPLVIPAFGVDPTNSSILYAGGFNGVARSADAGASWSLAGTGPSAPTRIESLAIDPSSPGVILAGTLNRGLFRSANSGGNWEERNVGIPTNGGLQRVHRIVVDPTDSQVAYLLIDDPDDEGQLLRSTNGGQSWSRFDLASGLSQTAVFFAFAVDAANTSTLYLGTNEGIFKSVNGGLNWQLLNGINAPPHARDVLLNGPDIIVAPSAFGARRSVDAGVTWESIDYPPALLASRTSHAVLNPRRLNRIVAALDQEGIAEFEVAPDLALTVTGVDVQMPAGAARTVVLRAENRGIYTASGVMVTLDIPGLMVPGTPVPQRGSCVVVPSVIQCSLGALAPGAQASVTVPMTIGPPNLGGVFVANLFGNESDSVPGNSELRLNLSSAEIADLGVTLTPAPATVNNGSSVRLTARASNAGPSPVAAVSATVTLPAGIAFTSATPSAGTCTTQANTVTCNLGALPSGQEVTIQVDGTASVNGAQVATAAVTGAVQEVAAANNSASATVTVRAPPSSGGGGGGGGGGSLGAAVVATLLALLAWRRRAAWRVRRSALAT